MKKLFLLSVLFIFMGNEAKYDSKAIEVIDRDAQGTLQGSLKKKTFCSRPQWNGMPIYYKAHLGGLFLYLYYKIYFMNKFSIIFLASVLVK